LADSLRNKLLEQLMDKLVETHTIMLPQSMINAELENSWKSFIQRFGMPEEQIVPILEAQGKTKADMMKDWEADAVKNLKGQLVLGKIQEQEKIEVSDEEMDAEMAKQAEAYGMSKEDLKKTFGENGLVEYLKKDIQQKKLVDYLLNQSKKAKGEKFSYQDFIKA
jgi:trigger factor